MTCPDSSVEPAFYETEGALNSIVSVYKHPRDTEMYQLIGEGRAGWCVCGTYWEHCCLLTWPSISVCPSSDPATPPPRAHQSSARPGISPLISHLRSANELRLLLHLWDPTDYQTGATICQWREVAFTRLTLLPKGEKSKWSRKQRSRKEKKSNPTVGCHVIHVTDGSVQMLICQH